MLDWKELSNRIGDADEHKKIIADFRRIQEEQDLQFYLHYFLERGHLFALHQKSGAVMLDDAGCAIPLMFRVPKRERTRILKKLMKLIAAKPSADDLSPFDVEVYEKACLNVNINKQKRVKHG